MFGHLDISDKKKFRKEMTKEFSDFLVMLRNKHDAITSTVVWGQLQELKGEFYSGSININEFINRANSIAENINEVGDAYHLIRACLKDIEAIRHNPRYQALINEAGGPQVPSASVSTATLFQDDLHRMPVQSATIADRLLAQIKRVEDKNIDKSEMVRALIAASQSGTYNGYFINVDKDVLSKIKKDEFDQIDDKNKKAMARESRTDHLLITEIDQFIDASTQAGKDRVSIIMQSGNHYTALDIDINHGTCLIVDAAQDMRRIRLHRMGQYSKYIKPERVMDVMSAKFEFDNQIQNGALQKDEQSCSIFALFHSFVLAEMREIHAELFKKSKTRLTLMNDNIRGLEWIDLPPKLVSIGQSTTFIAYYLSKHPEHKSELLALTNNNEKGYGFKQAIDMFEDKLKTICATIREDEINALINPRMGYETYKYK